MDTQNVVAANFTYIPCRKSLMDLAHHYTHCEILRQTKIVHGNPKAGNPRPSKTKSYYTTQSMTLERRSSLPWPNYLMRIHYHSHLQSPLPTLMHKSNSMLIGHDSGNNFNFQFSILSERKLDSTCMICDMAIGHNHARILINKDPCPALTA